MRVLKTAPCFSAQGGVLFKVSHRREEIDCEVSREALADHFGADESDPMQLMDAFRRNRGRIGETAMIKLPLRIDRHQAPVLWSSDFN